VNPPAGLVPATYFILIFLVPLALAGLAIMNTGLGRTRSAAHFMLASMSAVALAACVYVLWGFSWEGVSGQVAHIVFLGGRPWDWIATDPFLWHGLAFDSSRVTASAFLQVFTVGLAAMIPLASGADRWRLTASLISTALLAGWIYPLFAHWVWGGGWLSELGTNYGLGIGFVDAGGASTIHVVGALSALSMVWILGPRFGKYSAEGVPAAIPGYNIVYVLLGCGLMLPGWIALNAAGSLLFVGTPPGQIALVAVNTFLCASAGCLAALATTGVRFSKPDASLCGNGWVGGLVTSSAIAPFVTPGVAILTGFVAGLIVVLSIEFLEMHLSIDDPGGAISSHGLAGLWGLLASGIFMHLPRLASTGFHPRGQFLAQVVGIATLLGFVLPMTFGLNWILNRLHVQRVDRQGDRLGMDLRELGGGAYPEFVVRSDEYTQR
jgi:ammonium transporter, Amt family